MRRPHKTGGARVSTCQARTPLPPDDGKDREREAEPATEEDLQARDASEMPREPQNPVDPKADAAT
jgi:hypothetical protein